MGYNYRIVARTNGYGRAYFEVQRRVGCRWCRISHPQGKILTTMRHAQNFLSWHRRETTFPGCCINTRVVHYE